MHPLGSGTFPKPQMLLARLSCKMLARAQLDKESLFCCRVINYLLESLRELMKNNRFVGEVVHTYRIFWDLLGFEEMPQSQYDVSLT